MVRPSPARRSMCDVQHPHTSARGRQLELFASFCTLRHVKLQGAHAISPLAKDLLCSSFSALCESYISFAESAQALKGSEKKKRERGHAVLQKQPNKGRSSYQE